MRHPMVMRDTPRVVLVDDNPADSAIMELAIRQTGIAVELVALASARELLGYLEGQTGRCGCACDLLILDLNLPGISGFELLEMIRSDERFQCLPVIVVSGSRNPDDVGRCYRCGANSYICKSPELSEIMQTAKRLIDYWFGCVALPGAHPTV